MTDQQQTEKPTHFGPDTCGTCGVELDDTRIFGSCRPCAEFRSAMRKKSKAERDAIYSAMQKKPSHV